MKDTAADGRGDLADDATAISGVHEHPRTAISGVVSTALLVGWGALGVLASVLGVLCGAGAVNAQRWWDAPAGSVAESEARDRLVDVDGYIGVGWTVVLVAGLAQLVVLAFWTHQAFEVSQRLWNGPRKRPFRRSLMRCLRRPWMVFAVPKLAITEIELIARAPRDHAGRVGAGWEHVRPVVVGRFWWAGMQLSFVAALLAVPRLEGSFGSSDGLVVGYAVAAGCLAAFTLCCGCGAVYLRRIAADLGTGSASRSSGRRARDPLLPAPGSTLRTGSGDPRAR